MGTTILIYIATATIFPVLIPGMTVTGGIHGGGVLDRPFAFWILTVPTFGWAIIGWWTLVSVVPRRARRSQ